MYNFYQSELWKHINRDVYRKPTIQVDLFWYTYQAILWQKKLWPVTLTWLQILGVTWLSPEQMGSIKNELKPVQQKYKPFCIQIWYSDILHSAASKDLDKPAVIAQFHKKHAETRKMMEWFWYKKSHKENLPPSTYIVDILPPLEKLRTTISAQHKNKIKKAQKHHVVWSVAELDEIDEFYPLLASTGNNKWFGVIWPKAFKKLMEDLYANRTGKLFIVRYEGKIVWWAVYLLDRAQHVAVYLYGATDRSVGNIGIGQYIHWYIFDDLQAENIYEIDLLGGAPTGDKKHHLAAVGSFKEWFGGKKVEFIWSFDIVYNKLLYKLWSFYRKHSRH